MPFIIVRQDIIHMGVDAIVNAANTDLRAGGGVCGAIFNAAGKDELRAACKKLAPIQTGEAVVTPGFGLHAKYIIHTAGPIYRDGNHGEEAALRACYINSLKRAAEHGCESVAFPLISSGIYGYPKADALRVANSAILEFLAEHEITVYLAVFDKAAFTLSETMLGEVESFIDQHYVDARSFADRGRRVFEDEHDVEEYYIITSNNLMSDYQAFNSHSEGLEGLVKNLDEPFSVTLLRLIDAKGLTDAQVYKRANLDRKLFSKIRTVKEYTPSKKTAIAFALALELTLGETTDLLKRAGYALSHSSKFDVIIEYFIRCEMYDIFAINEVLFRYDQPLLGG